MKVIAMIQARTGSTRLRGKTMADIKGKPMLEHLIDRIKTCATLNSIVVATTERKEDDVIAALAEKCGIGWFRGAEDDVLDRYVKAAEKFKADVIVRICADNPLTDPWEVDKLVRFHTETQADYSYNNRPHPNSLPDGIGAEVISMDTLMRIYEIAKEQPYREHVTLFAYDNPNLFHVERLDADPDLRRPDIKLDVDFSGDLQYIREVLEELCDKGKDNSATTKEIIAAVDAIQAAES